MKKIFSLILAAVLALSLVSLVACGDDNTDVTDMLTTASDMNTTVADDDETTEKATDSATEEGESMTGNVESNSDGVIEDSTKDDTSTTAR